MKIKKLEQKPATESKPKSLTVKTDVKAGIGHGSSIVAVCG